MYKGNPATHGAEGAREENRVREHLRIKHGKLDVDKEIKDLGPKGYRNLAHKLHERELAHNMKYDARYHGNPSYKDLTPLTPKK